MAHLLGLPVCLVPLNSKKTLKVLEACVGSLLLTAWPAVACCENSRRQASGCRPLSVGAIQLMGQVAHTHSKDVATWPSNVEQRLCIGQNI